MSDLKTALGEALDIDPEAETEETEVEAKAVEPEAKAEEPEAEAKEPEPKPEPEHQVPLPVFMEMKNEVKALKAELQKQREAKPDPKPDFIDPEGADYLQKRVDTATQNVLLNLSEEQARETYGDQKVDEAFQALQVAQDSAVYQSIMAARSPYKALVKWYDTQTMVREIGTDPAAYRERLAAEVRAEVEAEMATKQVRDRAGKFAPSLANVTGTGGGPKTTYTGPTPLDKVLGE